MQGNRHIDEQDRGLAIVDSEAHGDRMITDEQTLKEGLAGEMAQ